jgi:hypothetical protein
LQDSYDEYTYLEFPKWLVHLLSIANFFGIIAILKSKSQSLKDFAYAGFLMDLICASGGHIALQEIKLLLPIASIILWAFTYRIDIKYNTQKTTFSCRSCCSRQFPQAHPRRRRLSCDFACIFLH